MEIKLNSTTKINLAKLIESRMLIQANSGGGKSHTIRRLLEQTHGKVQQIVIDPEGEFATLREKYDYILAGKDGDAPADPRSAALLARRLLELGASCIIDLYELHPQARKHFVRLFLEALINAPKELWHDCLVVIDEAHVFAPEQGVSEALDAVIGLAALGRKRGFCAVLATQRISKLHKDAAAECNNKLIGRASIDIDMKRAAAELGFTSKEQMLSLRALKPGEFYAFGPAISDEVRKIKVGDITTVHPKAGSKGHASKAPPPTDKIKKILAKLADIPKEAEKEINSIVVANKRIRELEGELRVAKRAPAPAAATVKIQRIEVPVVGKRTLDRMLRAEKGMRRILSNIKAAHANSALDIITVEKIVERFATEIQKAKPGPIITGVPLPVAAPTVPRIEHRPRNVLTDLPREKVTADMTVIPAAGGPVTGSPLELLKTLTSYFPDAITRQRAAAIAKISPRKSTFRNAISVLKTQGYIEVQGDELVATQAGMDALGAAPEAPKPPEEVRAQWLRELPEGPSRMLELLIGQYPSPIDRLQLAELCRLDPNVSTFRNYLSTLRSRGLIDSRGNNVLAAATLF